jgi:hypothetical protein
VLDADHSGTIDYEEFVKYAAGGAQLSALAAKGVDRQVVSFFEQIGRSQNQAKEQLDELLAAIVDFSTETLRDHAVWRYTDSTHTQRWSLGAACIKLLISVLRLASLAATSSSEELDELGDHPAALDLLNKLLHNLPIGSAVLSCATRLADEYIATCAADFHRGIFSVLRKKLKSSDPGVAVVVSEEQPALFEHPDFRRGRDSVSKFEEAALEDLAGAAFTLLHHTLTACGVEWLASDKVALFTRGRVIDAQRRSDSSAAKIGGGSRLHSATSAYPAAQHPIAAIVAFASYPVVVEGGPNLPQHAALLITELSRCMHAAQANSFASPLRSAASMAIRQALTLAEHEVQAHVKMHVIEGTVERELPSVQDALRRIRPPSLFSPASEDDDMYDDRGMMNSRADADMSWGRAPRANAGGPGGDRDEQDDNRGPRASDQEMESPWRRDKVDDFDDERRGGDGGGGGGGEDERDGRPRAKIGRASCRERVSTRV